MDILIDTNIFIYREDDQVIPEPLQELERTLNSKGHRILIHPLSKEEIQRDSDEERTKKALSKIETYADLDYPNYPMGDGEFRKAVPEADYINDRVDNALLFSVFDESVDFLITEDTEIHEKGLRLGIDDQVFTIEEGRDFFKEDPPEVRGPESIKRETLGDIDVTDPIFDSLRSDYEEFEDWFKSHPDRPAYINLKKDGSLGAILIIKPSESERIGDPPLSKRERLKISTLKVSEERRGQKTGELLLSIAIRAAVNHRNEEIYLTHYQEEEDYLVELINEFGFSKEATESDGEAIFIKRTRPGFGDKPTPLETSTNYYPSYYDGRRVDKFLVPVQPKYHDKLFTSYSKRQSQITEFAGELHAEGNAIRKAYVCNSPVKKISPGDVLLFYQSRRQKEVTSVGVCESVRYGLSDPDNVLRIVGKRSVFTEYEIQEIADKDTTVIKFRWHFDLENPVSWENLQEKEVIPNPVTIRQLDDEGYQYIKDNGGIDERFTFD